MKLAVSNIAWPAPLRAEAYALLRQAGIAGLEIAPGLLMDGCADPFAPTGAELARVHAQLADAGLQLVSMQSLLFGVNDAQLFGDAGQRDRFIAGMQRAIALAGVLGVPNLVFGSPRQRVRPDAMPPAEAHGIAAEIFRRLGDAALAAGTRIAMEPNGKAYGTNFLNRIAQAEAFVRAVDHPGVVLNFDLGAAHMEGDFSGIEALAAHAVDCIGHVHISEPGLAPAPLHAADAARAMRALLAAGYAGWFSIEMAATAQPLDDLAGALARLDQAVAMLAADAIGTGA